MGEPRSQEELDAFNKKFEELFDAYGKGIISSQERKKEIESYLGNFRNERAIEKKILNDATPEKEIYNIHKAVEFARKNYVSLDNPLKPYEASQHKIIEAVLSRNCLDKINSGKARGKTNNNRLHCKFAEAVCSV